MRKSGLLLLFTLFVVGLASAETYSSWKTYLAYYNTTAVAEGNEKVFALADGSLYIYGKEDKSVTFYSKEKGLSDNQISMMRYNTATHSILLFYSNGNIDLMDEQDHITNLPYLKENTNIQDKTVNNIDIFGNNAYLSMNFGILVVNMQKKEIADTYKLSRAVYSVCIEGSTIYAATSTGIISAATSSNLLDANNWNSFSLNDASIDANAVRQLSSFNNNLCFWVKGNGVFYKKADGTITSLRKQSALNGMTLQNGKLICYSSSQAFVYSSLTSSFTINADTINGISSEKDPNIYWIASGYSGIKCVENSNGSFAVTVSDLLDNTASPKRNLDAYMLFHNNKLLITGGGRWLDRYNNAGTLMVYDSSRWTNFNETTIAAAAKIKFSDATAVAVDPADNNHYFVSTWGEGVFEFKDNAFANLYSLSNSTLQSALSGSSTNNYMRVDGLTYDSNGNLWMTNTAANGNGGICILKPDGTWLSYSDGNYYSLKNQNLIDKILITSNGDKWVNIARGSNAGIFVFNENNTIDDPSDDNTILYTSLTSTSGSALSVSGYYCMAEDKSNQIWIGTNSGLVVCSNPQNALSNGKAYFSHITRANNEGTLSYFLNGEKINAIAVDGGNRKWIGTESSGLYLISADGSETISSFTTGNSPLLSDEILSITINNNTGEVFIGTSKGLVSYMSGATSGSDKYSNVYAYPNPVRPEYDDKVTVTGLMEGSNVKITDLSGNIIYQTKSLGGQATWNCCNRSGKRVATGVYLVMAATEDSSESVVTKIMIVR